MNLNNYMVLNGARNESLVGGRLPYSYCCPTRGSYRGSYYVDAQEYLSFVGGVEHSTVWCSSPIGWYPVTTVREVLVSYPVTSSHGNGEAVTSHALLNGSPLKKLSPRQGAGSEVGDVAQSHIVVDVSPRKGAGSEVATSPIVVDVVPPRNREELTTLIAENASSSLATAQSYATKIALAERSLRGAHYDVHQQTDLLHAQLDARAMAIDARNAALFEFSKADNAVKDSIKALNDAQAEKDGIVAGITQLRTEAALSKDAFVIEKMLLKTELRVSDRLLHGELAAEGAASSVPFHDAARHKGPLTDLREEEAIEIHTPTSLVSTPTDEEFDSLRRAAITSDEVLIATPFEAADASLHNWDSLIVGLCVDSFLSGAWVGPVVSLVGSMCMCLYNIRWMCPRYWQFKVYVDSRANAMPRSLARVWSFIR